MSEKLEKKLGLNTTPKLLGKMKSYHVTGNSKYIVCVDLCIKVNEGRISNKYFVLFDKNSYLCRKSIRYQIKVIKSKFDRFEASICLSN